MTESGTRSLPYKSAMHLYLMLGVCLISDVIQGAEPEAADHFEATVRPILVKYCGDCHDPEDKKNKIDFLKACDAEDISKDRELWKNVALQLRNRTMPPVDEEQPSEDDRFQLSVWISETLRSTACQADEYAGPVTARRLNRTEYDNTIRDLVGIKMDFTDFLPTDGSGGEGFDNNGETLFLPPLLMERYLEAAQRILDAAVITPRFEKEFNPIDFLPPQAGDSDAYHIQTGKEAGIVVNVYLEGDYTLKLYLETTATEHSKAVLKVDGIPADRFEIKPVSNEEKQPFVTVKVHLARGLHSLAVHIPGDAQAVQFRQFKISEEVPKHSNEKTLAHQRIFGTEHKETPQGAKQIINTFMHRAFRRPVTDAEVDRFFTLCERGSERGDPFAEAVKLALRAVLISPHFLFRVEPIPAESGIQPLDDYALATRLSYFLWVSMPDDELFALAAQGKLNDEQVLNEQITRMLKDPKVNAFAEEFTGQWLGTHEVARRVVPSTEKFKNEFSTELLIDMRNEPVHFIHHLLSENGSLLDLLASDYSYINARLAKEYGVKDVTGEEFRKYVFKEGERGGVLGMGGVHLLTSYPDRTSQVLRGAWVLETLLGTPVPSPPADVPPLEKAKVAKDVSMREKLKKHRDNPACAACHDIIDPIGFGLDNFDVLGRWRDKEGKNDIDASGVMPDGKTFNGPKELKQILADKQAEYIQHLTEKMLGYALGRSLVDEDQCVLQRLTEHLESKDYKAQELIRGIVVSKPFRMIQYSEEAQQN